MSKTRIDLLGALWQIQAHPLFSTVDVLTPAASPKVSDEQVRNHIEGLMRFIAKQGA